VPKYRREVLAGDVEKRLLELIHKAAARYQAEVIALEISPDHVHLFVEVDPPFGLHRLVKYSKAVTSHELRKEFASLRTRLASLWTNSYFCSTVGGAPLEVIKPCVENQKNV
jgi:putative transposase